MKTIFALTSLITTLCMSSAFAGQCSDGNVAIQKALDNFIASNKGVRITHVAARADDGAGLDSSNFEVILGTEIPSLPSRGFRLVKFLIEKQTCEVTYENALMLNEYSGPQPQ